MARTSLTLAVAVAAGLAGAPAAAQVPSGSAASTAPPGRSTSSTPTTPKVVPPNPPAVAAVPVRQPQAPRPFVAAGAQALADALAPDLRSSVGIPKAIFIQRFVAESLYRFDREHRRAITSEQLRQNISQMQKEVREGADRWWNEANRTKSGKVSRDDALAAATDQFRKVTGLTSDQTETKQQSSIRESFERGAAQQFSRFDVDGDGYVIRSEVDRRIMEDVERVERSARIASALIEDGTRGRKGFLDLDKATVALGGAFDALDLNRDGTLSAEELPAVARRFDPAYVTKATASTKTPAASEPRNPRTQTTAPRTPATSAPGLPKAQTETTPAAAVAAEPARSIAKPRPQQAQKPAAQRPPVDPSLFAKPLPTIQGYGVSARTAQPSEDR